MIQPSSLNRTLVTLVLAVLIAVLAGGCAAYKEDRKQDALEAATNAYQTALRWGYYETAIGYIHPDKRKVLEVPKELVNIRVTRYDVVQPPIPAGEGKVTQVVQIDYLHQDVQRMKSLSDRQEWRYDPETKTWWLYSGLPAFK
jgi:hypothetical protein